MEDEIREDYMWAFLLLHLKRALSIISRLVDEQVNDYFSPSSIYNVNSLKIFLKFIMVKKRHKNRLNPSRSILQMF